MQGFKMDYGAGFAAKRIKPADDLVAAGTVITSCVSPAPTRAPASGPD